MNKRKKRRRVILGIGYPWFYQNGDMTGYFRVGLFPGKNAQGDAKKLNYGGTGAWKKWKLVLEEV